MANGPFTLTMAGDFVSCVSLTVKWLNRWWKVDSNVNNDTQKPQSDEVNFVEAR